MIAKEMEKILAFVAHHSEGVKKRTHRRRLLYKTPGSVRTDTGDAGDKKQVQGVNI